jgi:hypothetical protein
MTENKRQAPSADDIKALKAKHGKLWSISFGAADGGTVVFRRPTPDEIDRYFDTLDDRKSQAVRELAEAVVVWPDATQFQSMCHEFGGIHIDIASRAREAAGMGKAATPVEL